MKYTVSIELALPRERGSAVWQLFAGRPEPQDGPPAAEVRMGTDTAWRLFTKGISPG